MRNERSLISPAELDSTDLPPWVSAAIDEFDRRVRDADAAFPCHFARTGLRSASIRFAFVEDAEAAPALDAFAEALRAYVELAPAIDGHTSLVAFFRRPRLHACEQDYHAWFWRVLQELHARDAAPWPASVPSHPEDPRWEFCFGGTPLFALGTGPLHRVRASRHAGRVTLAFQPRFVFDRAFATPRHYDRACDVIRARVERYDGGQPVHPALGAYRDPESREWRQYVVPDTNDAAWAACPFSARGITEEVA